MMKMSYLGKVDRLYCCQYIIIFLLCDSVCQYSLSPKINDLHVNNIKEPINIIFINC